MHPRIDVFGLAQLNGYGLALAAGIALAAVAMTADARRRGLTRFADGLHWTVLWMLVAGFVGGKLAYALLHGEAFRRTLEQNGWAAAMQSGFVFYGSLLLCVPVALARFARSGEGVLRQMDVLILAAPIVHGMGRVGCFLAGCCYGRPSDAAWAVASREGDAARAPVQLVEAAGEALIFALLWLVVRKRARFDGEVLLGYLALYGMLRFGTELLRGDPRPTAQLGAVELSAAQVVCLVLAPASVCLMVLARRRAASQTPSASPAVSSSSART